MLNVSRFQATCQSTPSEGLFFNRTHTSVAGRGGLFMIYPTLKEQWFLDERRAPALSAVTMLMQWVVSKAPPLWKFVRSVMETLLERMF